MPRTYVRKKIKTYTPQNLAEAIEKVKNGEMTQYSAAKQYNIPMTTLFDHINESTGNSRPSAGRPIVIPLEDEKELAEAITVMEKWGFGLSRFEIMEIVAEYVRVNEISTPFKNNVPGPDWFINFRKRHGLSIKKAQSVEYVRKKMTDPFVIAEYFDLLQNTLNDLNLFESPQAIWNLDETSMCLDPSKTKVVGKINKPCSRTTYGSGKENTTVLAGANASGKKLPPLIVFKGKSTWDTWMSEQDPAKYDFEVQFATSTKGWMETDIFYNYFNDVLIPNLGEERPVLVLYDGHSTHVNVRVVQLAIENNVTILKLPPHTSHLLQPLDLAVFRSFKAIWDAKLVEWQRRNVGIKMSKKVFSETLADTWQQTSADVIKSGFKKAGIYPFDAQVIPVEKFDPDAYKRYQKKISEALRSHVEPKSLKDICMAFFNNITATTATNDALERSNSDKVTLLSEVPKSNVQTLRFVANQPTQLPICLKNTQSIQNSAKINIISNKIIAKAPLIHKPQRTCTFEELVLRKIEQDKKDNTVTKRKRVTTGAEVITAKMAKKILEERENTKVTKKLTKTSKNDVEKGTKVTKKDSSKNKKNKTTQKQIEQPGPSGIKNKKKRKRQPSLDSITSVSDNISEHSDSDIIDDIESMDEYFQENEEIKTSQNKTKDAKYEKKVKRWENSTDLNILTNRNPSTLSTKGKGVGKKSKGKENQTNENDEEKEQKNHESDSEDDLDLFMIGKQMNDKDKDNTDIRHIVTANEDDIKKDVRNKGIVREIQEEDEIEKDLENKDIEGKIQEEDDIEKHLENKDIVLENPETADVEKNLKKKGTESKIQEEDGIEKDLKKKGTEGKIQEKDSIEKDLENKDIVLENQETDDAEKDLKNKGTEGKIQEEDDLEKDLENKDIVHENQEEDPTKEEIYKVNDTVLVRYLIRKKWKYYIGHIETITTSHERTWFSINFLKQIRSQQQLIFMMPKRKDIDKVPESLLVKKIDIQKKDNEKKYYLCDNGDTIYFD